MQGLPRLDARRGCSCETRDRVRVLVYLVEVRLI